jgi:hypothetical protein
MLCSVPRHDPEDRRLFLLVFSLLFEHLQFVVLCAVGSIYAFVCFVEFPSPRPPLVYSYFFTVYCWRSMCSLCVVRRLGAPSTSPREPQCHSPSAPHATRDNLYSLSLLPYF